MKLVRKIMRAVPPPVYMQLPSVGVDVSDTSLKYVKFKADNRSGRTLELEHWGDITIPDGSVRRGTVHEAKHLTEAIRAVRENTGIAYARVSLPEERAYLFETEVQKGTPFKEIRGLLEFKLEENVPLSPRDAFFDYDIINPHSDGPVRVSVTAYARDTVMSYYDACMAAKVIPLSFEVEAQAIARAAIPHHDQGTKLIVDFGQTRTGIGIVHRGVLMYTSTIDIGGQQLSAAIRSVKGDISESECTEIKNTIGLTPAADDDSIYTVLESAMASIASEVETRMNYWHGTRTSISDRRIDTIVLCGGSVNMRGVPEYLSQKLRTPAVRADVWKNASLSDAYVPPIKQRYAYGYATAIGLALAPFSNV